MRTQRYRHLPLRCPQDRASSQDHSRGTCASSSSSMTSSTSSSVRSTTHAQQAAIRLAADDSGGLHHQHHVRAGTQPGKQRLIQRLGQPGLTESGHECRTPPRRSVWSPPRAHRRTGPDSGPGSAHRSQRADIYDGVTEPAPRNSVDRYGYGIPTVEPMTIEVSEAGRQSCLGAKGASK